MRGATMISHSTLAEIAATVAALFSVARPELPFRVVTFGAPRVGFLFPWIGFRPLRAVGHVQYARWGDIVPDLPMRPYLHGGRLTRIGVSLGDFVANHTIAQYAADLKALGA